MGRLNVATVTGRGNEQEWNGVGIVLSKELKEDLISVSRKSDPVMNIKLGL